MATFNIKNMTHTSSHFRMYEVLNMGEGGHIKSRWYQMYQARTWKTNLNDVMIAQKIACEDLAVIVGVCKTTLYFWRHGVHRPHRNNLMVLNRVFYDVTKGKGIYFRKNPNKRQHP